MKAAVLTISDGVATKARALWTHRHGFAQLTKRYLKR